MSYPSSAKIVSVPLPQTNNRMNRHFHPDNQVIIDEHIKFSAKAVVGICCSIVSILVGVGGTFLKVSNTQHDLSGRIDTLTCQVQNVEHQVDEIKRAVVQPTRTNASAIAQNRN